MLFLLLQLIINDLYLSKFSAILPLYPTDLSNMHLFFIYFIFDLQTSKESTKKAVILPFNSHLVYLVQTRNYSRTNPISFTPICSVTLILTLTFSIFNIFFEKQSKIKYILLYNDKIVKLIYYLCRTISCIFYNNLISIM